MFNLQNMFFTSLQDRISGRREGSVSACELSMEAGAPSEVKCELRPPDLSGAPPGDTFEDQMMGVSVLAAENGEKVNFHLCHFANYRDNLIL